MDQNILNKLLSTGVEYGASDIHFLVGIPPAYRMKGVLVPIKMGPLKPEDTLEIVKILLSREKSINLETIREFDTSYSLAKLSRFRVNIFKQRGTFGAILRIIPPEVPTLEQLKLPKVLKDISGFERGLVLVTGVTGSGKSSTLAAMINEVNATLSGKHILTIEDPIEFIHPHKKCTVTQREIGHDTESFGVALRAALRQDPDIILVGEMRDYETIDTALKAAETGHLVFSTVHTTDAAKTIGRLISVFPAEAQQAARYRLADALRATISQRLIEAADKKGRVVAAEIMIVTNRVRDYILDEEKSTGLTDVIIEGKSQYGMQSFDQHLSILYRQGLITLPTARAAATSPTDFQRALDFE